MLPWILPEKSAVRWNPASQESPAPSPSLRSAFETSFAAGLLTLLKAEADQKISADPLPGSIAFWLPMVTRWRRDLTLYETPPLPSQQWMGEFLDQRPLLPGWDTLSPEAVRNVWNDLNTLQKQQQGAASRQSWLDQFGTSWKVRGRITLHLAENPAGGANPFLFIATYVEPGPNPKHLPLGRAIKLAGKNQERDRLSDLLTPILEGARRSAVIRQLVESNAMYQPQAWSARQAKDFLDEIPLMNEAGLAVKAPDWWKTKSSRPSAKLEIGGENKSLFGGGSLLGFRAGIALGDRDLTREELETLLQSEAPLVSFKGAWVEVDKDRLRSLLDWWRTFETAHEAGLPLATALRFLGGYLPKDPATQEWERRHSEPLALDCASSEELTRFLQTAREPIPESSPGLQATLRNYQRDGVSWLRFGSKLGLGLCLADDMGLGKTIQVISSWLLATPLSSHRHLLICPASLIGNWNAELTRFAPSLPVLILHGAESRAAHSELSALPESGVVITTYSMLPRLPALFPITWSSITLDEAQAIKNPASERARQVKQLRGTFRLALTGTPLENGPSDLWSLFDFLMPGWLGDLPAFLQAAKSPSGAAALRATIAPLLLRRLKTDPGIAPELPPKLERKIPCLLTRRQAALYSRAVRALQGALPGAEPGVQRKGLILQTLLRLKQICDHPSLFAGDGDFQTDDSGKCGELARIASRIARAGERMLIFTQFRQMMDPLSDLLTGIFERPGLQLHGAVPAAERAARVRAFQQPDGPPFFVISLQAGGTGLNLTAASHVIHFDRWWNPAVERQATDRAFRIGQTSVVTSHTLICTGTFEEKLDQMLRQKSAVAEDWLDRGESGEAPRALWNMGDEELLRFFSQETSSDQTADAAET